MSRGGMMEITLNIWRQRYMDRLTQGGMSKAAAYADFCEQFGDGRKLDLNADPEEKAKARLIDLISGGGKNERTS